MTRPGMMSGGAICVLALAAAGAACAQAPRAYDIPAGSLRDALTRYAAQSDQQMFYAAALVDGRSSLGLKGRFTPAEALDRLLEGSGLTWSETRPGVVYLRRPAPRDHADAAATVVEDVVVTGSLLRQAGPAVSPVITLDRKALDKRSEGTVAEILTSLPQNYAGAATPLVQGAGSDRGGSNSAFGTGVNLRGLGPSSTLVLVNGRRMAGSGFRAEFADVSALPSAAVERVDILLDGASALYGADAVAGVVNVILRRSFDGQETRVRASAARGGGEDVILSHLAGRSWTGGAAYLSAEYQQVNALSSLDRAYTADGDLRPFGGTDHRTLFSAPGNILAYDPTAGAYVSRFAIRPGPSGAALTPDDFVAGAANRQSAMLGNDLTPAMERYSLYARVAQSVGDALDLTADLRYSRRDFHLSGSAGVGLFNVAAANPWFVSPNGSSSHLIGYSFLEEVGSTRQDGRSESGGLTLAARYQLPAGWSVETYGAWAEERTDLGNTNRINSRFVGEALGSLPDDPATPFSAARDGYLNLFGGPNTLAVLDFISSGFTQARDRSRSGSANILAEGPLWTLPGGEVRVAVGGQWRRETFETSILSLNASVRPMLFATPEVSREIAAVFAEARIPIVGEGNARPGIRSLDLSLAGRLETYDDFGDTANPRLGLAWSPGEGLMVRTSWGTSFRAASLPQVHDTPGVSGTLLSRADGGQALSLLIYGGNPDLKPETADTFTAGFDWRAQSGFVLDLNYFDTRFTDRIAQPVTENLTGALVDPALAPFVTLVSPATNPADLALIRSYSTYPGFPALYPPETYAAIVDTRWVNTGAVKVRGVDVTARYPFRLVGQDLSVETAASWILDYDSRPTPTAEVRQVVGLVGYPGRLRVRSGANWTRGSLGASLHWSHVSSVRDRLGQTVEDWNTFDAQVSWSPSSGPEQGTRLALSVQNLFDEDPPFYDSAAGYGFDAGQANPMGRVVALQLIKRW
nr:TonB-dependent receptor [uncultured Brevundimonas sp.]